MKRQRRLCVSIFILLSNFIIILDYSKMAISIRFWYFGNWYQCCARQLDVLISLKITTCAVSSHSYSRFKCPINYHKAGRKMEANGPPQIETGMCCQGVKTVLFYIGSTFSTWCSCYRFSCVMMTSSNGSIFRVTGHLCGEFTGHRWIPLTKASGVGLWCFLWSAPE